MDLKELSQNRERLVQAKDTCAAVFSGFIDEIDADISKIEAEKPKLRHGDYGLVWDADDQPSRFVYFRVEDGKDPVIARACAVPHVHAWFHMEGFKRVILGNIFDDLKALQEPLEEFEIDSYRGPMSVSWNSNDCTNIHFCWTKREHVFNDCNLDEFILNLRRMRATQKRKANEKAK